MDSVPEGWRSIDAAPPEPSDTPAPPPLRAIVVLGTAALALFAAAVLLVASSANAPPSASMGAAGSDGPGALVEPAATASWFVHVAGAVTRPGVYELPAGSRVADAIRAAGGYSARVDTSAADTTLNLAEVLRDGAKILVPERGAVTGPSPTRGADGGHAALIDLNRATAGELDTLPGIGPVTAAKIIAAREERAFRSIDELLERKVVSAAVLGKIRALVTVGG